MNKYIKINGRETKINKNKYIKRVSIMKTFFMILVILLTFLVGYIIGTKTELSYEDKNAQVENTLKTNEDYEEEYASETNEKFYKKMVRMERNSTLVFNGWRWNPYYRNRYIISSWLGFKSCRYKQIYMLSS